MQTFEESATNDFVVNDLNNLVIITNQNAIVQISRSVIERQRGEMQYLSDEGIPTAEVLWNGVPNQLQYQFYCRQAISQIDGVISVTQFNTQITETSQLTYDASITTIYGAAELTNELTL